MRKGVMSWPWLLPAQLAAWSCQTSSERLSEATGSPKSPEEEAKEYVHWLLSLVGQSSLPQSINSSVLLGYAPWPSRSHQGFPILRQQQ